MSKDEKLVREFFYQEMRFRRARRKARKYIHLAEAWNIIMKQAEAEQHRINEELKRYDQEDEP